MTGRDFGDLNRLVEFARKGGFSVTVRYWESSDDMEIEVISAAKAECYHEKHSAGVDEFIANWNRHLTSAADRESAERSERK